MTLTKTQYIFSRALTLLIAAISLPDCFSPDYGDVAFACGEGECPTGYQCVSRDNKDLCVRDNIADQVQQVTLKVLGNKSNVEPGGTIGLAVSVQSGNVKLVDPNKAASVKLEEGHYHVYLDKLTGDYLKLDFQPQTIVKVPLLAGRGAHKLIVSLRQSDHKPHPSGATAEWPFAIVVSNN